MCGGNAAASGHTPQLLHPSNEDPHSTDDSEQLDEQDGDPDEAIDPDEDPAITNERVRRTRIRVRIRPR